MGAARSALRRRARAPFEGQRQLEKVLDSDPKLAPKHESTKELLQIAKEENRTKFDAHNQKNEEYLNLLKQIRVDSVDVKESETKDSLKETPDQRGKLSSEQLVFLFQQRMTNHEEWNEEKIASHFQLPQASVENLLKYYTDYNVKTLPEIPEPLEDITF